MKKIIAILLMLTSYAHAFTIEEGISLPQTFTWQCLYPDIRTVFIAQFAQWNNACGGRFTAVESLELNPRLVIGKSPLGSSNLGQTYSGGAQTTIYISDSIPQDIDVNAVVLHEIGHALGLGHSPYISAIMFPYVRNYTQPVLSQDDIDGGRQIYALAPIVESMLEFKSFGTGLNRLFTTYYIVKWDFGDGGKPVFGKRVRHHFATRGTFTVTINYAGVDHSETISLKR